MNNTAQQPPQPSSKTAAPRIQAASPPRAPRRGTTMVGFYVKVCDRIPAFRKLSKLVMYQLMARFAPQPDWTFMNYGYAPLEPGTAPLTLRSEDEPNRYCIQLYHHAVGGIDLEGREVLEVGSGRGGGSHFIKRYMRPLEMTGVDYSRQAVALCQRRYKLAGLRFVHGDAEDLPFDDATFDAVVNVESSHCYGSMPRFLGEVARVLRPGGHFLFVDFRNAPDLPQLASDITASGLEVVRYQEITRNILAALEADNARKAAQIRAAAPRWLLSFFEQFAGAPGSHIHNRFSSESEIYVSYVLRKAA